VIRSGSHQYLVKKGDRIEIEKVPFKGKRINFSEVLLGVDGDRIKVGKPKVSGAKVEGKLLREFKTKKITTVKFKPKKRYKRVKGHRQEMIEVEIIKI